MPGGTGMPCAASSALACGFFWHSESAMEDRGDVVLVLGIVPVELDEVHHQVGLRVLDGGDERADVVADVDERDLVAAALERAHDLVHLVRDRLPWLDLQRRIPRDGAPTLTTVVLVHVVVDLVPEDQDTCHTAGAHLRVPPHA
jgi:hypothetical protein